jgi:hypothetical protein
MNILKLTFLFSKIDLLLFFRKENEILKGKELLDFAIVSETDQKRFNELMLRINLIDCSIHRVDAMVLLMEKF